MFDFREETCACADELADYYRQFLPDSDIDILHPRDEFQWRGRFAEAGERAMMKVACNGEWQVRSRYEAPGGCLAFIASGGLDLTVRNRSHTAGAGQAILTCVPEISQMQVLGKTQHARTTLRWSAGDAAAVLNSLYENASLDTLDPQPVIDLTTPQGKVLVSAAHTLALGLSSPEVRTSPALELISEAVLRLTFEQFPHRYTSQTGRAEVLPRHVKRAIEYMHAHLNEPLRISQIAAECGISARALENGFKDFKNVTPVAYLRQLRLQAVRRELLAAETATPIHAIALKWGFADAARFAARYRAVYGELPSETLHKRQYRRPR